MVHGHDEALVQKCARLLERLRVNPAVLFKQPGLGQTIVEKLEANRDYGRRSLLSLCLRR
ncbi:MAG: nucleotide-binding protein [Actinomycetia bacterium]|nr:nucleotide-binding protein [Actinomycetes bacterium]